MATQTQVSRFIEKIAKQAIAECRKRSKKVLPSVCIAQAAIETGWGTSSLMTKANAYFGIKANKSWGGKVYNSRTKECYDGKTYVNITACFRAYDSTAESVADYYDLITKNARYSGAVNEPDAKKCITAIKKGGYATDPTYVSKVLKIIKKYNLTKYDDVLTGGTGKVIKAGQTVQLEKVPLYSTATKKIKTRNISGVYYVWSASPINSRYRITNSKDRVGAAGQVTGWVDGKYIV